MSNRSSERTDVLQSIVYVQAKLHASRLGEAVIAASNKSWAHSEVMRAVRLADDSLNREAALLQLALLNASYAEAAQS